MVAINSRDSDWIMVTEAHFIHPKVGFVKQIGITWEAVPRGFFGPKKEVKTLEDGIRYLESFLP